MRTRYLGALAAVLLLAVAGSAAAAPILTEHFDNIATLPGAGWVQINNSSPLGLTNWFQGNSGVFAAYDGASDAYIAANFNNTGNSGTISNWMMTPELTLGPDVGLGFFTRTVDSSVYPDRIEVRLSTNGGSVDVGTTDASVGDFTTLLLTINPALAIGGYPEAWQGYHLPLGLGASTQGRIAFRYFVTDAGALGNNSNYIGIDNVSVEPVPEPATLTLVGLGAVALGLRRRRR